MNGILLVISVFCAAAVEAVEALTVVLAVGTTRHWRSALQGTVMALITLALIVALLGPSLLLIPISVLRTVVGAILLVFGLQWLRKAVLRGAGVMALHDETAIFARQASAARDAEMHSAWSVRDWYGFTLSFKAVLLEGLEVAFIVVAFVAGHQDFGLAVAAALAAVLVVAGAGAALHRPLARVPENTLKFVVGCLITTFGSFWSAEGVGAEWPGGDAALLGILPVVAAFAFGVTLILRAQRGVRPLAGGA